MQISYDVISFKNTKWENQYTILMEVNEHGQSDGEEKNLWEKKLKMCVPIWKIKKSVNTTWEFIDSHRLKKDFYRATTIEEQKGLWVVKEIWIWRGVLWSTKVLYEDNSATQLIQAEELHNWGENVVAIVGICRRQVLLLRATEWAG